MLKTSLKGGKEDPLPDPKATRESVGPNLVLIIQSKKAGGVRGE